MLSRTPKESIAASFSSGWPTERDRVAIQVQCGLERDGYTVVSKAEIERLRAALKIIADPNNVRLDASARRVAEALQGVARQALEQKANNSGSTTALAGAGDGNMPLSPPAPEPLCEDCPPIGYPTNKTRCEPCPRRTSS